LSSLKKICFLLIMVLPALSVRAQYSGFSVASDLNLLQSFQKNQRFYTLGDCIKFTANLTPKDGVYAWLSFYGSKDVYVNTEAIAKDPATIPADLPFKLRSSIRLHNVSLGWNHYFIRTIRDDDPDFGLYGMAGFGLTFGAVNNHFSENIDTASYQTPVKAGKSGFKRLTFDLGLGAEKNIGSEVFLFVETRCYVPASSYENPYLFVNKNAPLTGTLHVGLRVLFE